MVNLAKAFRYFRPFKVLVLGDFLLDTYTTGRVRRISPEAPVPVMEVIKHEARPGGAGNVVLNLLSLGAEVFVAGRVGDDADGQSLRHLLAQAHSCGLRTEIGYRTPMKNRLVAEGQQLIRVDFETITPLPIDSEEQILCELAELIPQMQVVALSDYGKGFLTDRLIREVLQMAKQAAVPSIVDPKGIDFAKYRGATLIKPNVSEAYAAAKMGGALSLDQVAQKLLEETKAQYLLITRSEAGISVFDAQERSDFPVRSKEVKDVTGAGDTVLATLCLGVANGLDIHTSTQLANIAAGLAIERFGCVQITLPELASRLFEIDCETKIFDESHLYALRQMLQGKRFSLLVLEKGQAMSLGLFRSIRSLSAAAEKFIIYAHQPHEELIHLLSSLQEVDHIILQSESLKHLCDEIHPQEIYRLERDVPVRLEFGTNALRSLMDFVSTRNGYVDDATS